MLEPTLKPKAQRSYCQILTQITIFVLGLFFLTSCTTTLRESPVIYISNASAKPLKNVKCEWASKHVLNLSVLNPGETRSQSFYIREEPEFFGLVRISWSNDDNKTIAREFFFRKVSLPSIEDRKTYNYVQLYIDQNYVDISTSDSPDIAGRTDQMDKMLSLYHNQYIKEHNTNDPAQLITVQPRRNLTFMGFLYR